MEGQAFLATAVEVLATPLVAEAQQAARTPRIAVLGLTPPAPSLADAFKQGLGEFGYTEGRNVAIESRDAEGRPSGCPSSQPTSSSSTWM